MLRTGPGPGKPLKCIAPDYLPAANRIEPERGFAYGPFRTTLITALQNNVRLDRAQLIVIEAPIFFNHGDGEYSPAHFGRFSPAA